jgi:hypothetical protein
VLYDRILRPRFTFVNVYAGAGIGLLKSRCFMKFHGASMLIKTQNESLPDRSKDSSDQGSACWATRVDIVL